MSETIPAKIQVRRGTAAEWLAANPVLLAGEIGCETDTGILRVGDGVRAWADLKSLGASLDTLTALVAVETAAREAADAAVAATAAAATATAQAAAEAAQATAEAAQAAATAATQYDNAVSGLIATTVKGAIDEVSAKVDALEGGDPVGGLETIAFGAVGSLAVAYNLGATVNAGSTIAGSNLRVNSAGNAIDPYVEGASSSSSPFNGGGSALSGTWRALGRTLAASYASSDGQGTKTWYSGLFLRIS